MPRLKSTSEALKIVPLIVLFLLYFVSREVNRRRGIQFDQIFAQIPPE